MGKQKTDKQKIEDARQSIQKQYKERIETLVSLTKAYEEIIKKQEKRVEELSKENESLKEYCKYLEELLKISDNDIEFIKEELEKRKSVAHFRDIHNSLFGIMGKFS